MTNYELMEMLPRELEYWGDYYYPRWVPETHYNSCTITYENEDGEVLLVDGIRFFIRTEKHYATYITLRMVLNYMDQVMKHVWYEDRYLYEELREYYLDSLDLLQEFNDPSNGVGTYDTRHAITVY